MNSKSADSYINPKFSLGTCDKYIVLKKESVFPVILALMLVESSSLCLPSKTTLDFLVFCVFCSYRKYNRYTFRHSLYSVIQNYANKLWDECSAVSQVVHVGTATFHTYANGLGADRKKGARKFSGNLNENDLVLYNAQKIFLCINITA